MLHRSYCRTDVITDMIMTIKGPVFAVTGLFAVYRSLKCTKVNSEFECDYRIFTIPLVI